MSEIKRTPIITYDANGDELATFDANHTHCDIARWVLESHADGEELHRILGEMLNKTDGMVMQ